MSGCLEDHKTLTISWIDSVNSAIGIAGFTVSMLGLLLSAALRIEDEWTNRFFPLLFSILALYTNVRLAILAERFAIRLA